MKPQSDDPREQTYWGEVDVTPAREDAWRQWKDNYVATCINGWVLQGESDREQLAKATSVVLHDLSKVDELSWMKLGHAMSWRLDAAFRGSAEYPDDQKTEYINSLRTMETASEYERVLGMAYHLGLNIQQATNLRDRVEETSVHRDPEREAKTALYRHLDRTGRLLYIGITKELEKRAEQHRAHSQWWRFVVRTRVEWFDTRADAADAEVSAIRAEMPIFNGTHNSANRRAAVDYLWAALEEVSA